MDTEPKDIARIELTQGYVAIIDAADLDREFRIESGSVSRTVRICDLSWQYEEGGTRPSGRRTGYARSGCRKDGIKFRIRLHRLIMQPKEWELVDHINEDGTDCRRANMQIVDNSKNLQLAGERRRARGERRQAPLRRAAAARLAHNQKVVGANPTGGIFTQAIKGS